MRSNFLKLMSPLFLLVLLGACGAEKVEEKPAENEGEPVQVQTVSESKTTSEYVEYPATILSEDEATVVAKAAGTVSEVHFELGDEVTEGQVLVQIDSDEANPIRTSYQNALNAFQNTQQITQNQIRMSGFGVEQAQTSLELARKNYQNTLASTAKDLEQALIARNQAQKNAQNVDVTTSDSFKSAELAYHSAQLATEQALLNFENRKDLLEKTSEDTRVNTETNIRSASDTLGTVLTSINSLIGYFDQNDIYNANPYDFGNLDSEARNQAIIAFQKAWETYIHAQKTQSTASLTERVEITLSFAEEVKALVDATKKLLDKTSPTTIVPLEQDKPLVLQYQNQVNALLPQLKTVGQTYENLDLNNKNTLDSLQKAYELAQQQEEISKQNLENVRAANTSQTDQSSSGANSADAQYEGTKIKLETQVNSAKSQADLAEIQYRNAVAAMTSAEATQTNQLDTVKGQLDLARIQLENLSPSAPIFGKISKKSVHIGDTVAAGQPLATISQTNILKLQFYIDSTFVPLISVGQEVGIITNGENSIRGAISHISPQADPTTKRFLVEVLPAGKGTTAEEQSLISGTIVNIRVEIKHRPKNTDAILLPLAALSIGPSESSLFIVENEKAKKIPVTVLRVEGETAEVLMDLNSDSFIITEGNKLLQDGDLVKITEETEDTPEPSL